jgi:cytochrome b6-f complex iron-sulfur subunit
MVVMSKINPPALSRGKFFQLCTRIIISLAGVLGLGGLVRYFSHSPQSGSPSTYHLGLAADFPTSGKLVRQDIPAVIYLSNQGFQAYSLICTHLGCTLEESEKGFSCPCHGSEFDPVGKVLRGPAMDDLSSLEIEVTAEGELLVHKNGGGI